MMNTGVPLEALPDPLALLDEHWGSWDDLSVINAELGVQLAPGASGSGDFTTAAATAAAGTSAAPAAVPPTDPELEKRRAQNRESMRRYRQRQRERIAEQQQQCEELAAELERARLENQAAVSSNQQLEARHSLRDDWLAVLRQLGEAQNAEQDQVLAVVAASCGHAAPDAVASSCSPETSTASSGDSEPSTGALQLAAWLESAASGSSSSSSGGSSGGQAAVDVRWVPTLAAAMASSLRASPGVLATLRSLSFPQTLQMYDAVLARVAELLATVEATGCKTAERQLTDLMVEACLFLDLLCLLRPSLLKLIMSVRGAAPAGSGDAQALYRDVVAAMCLTPGQRRGLLAEWRAFQARQAELASAVNASAADAAAAAAAPGGANDQPQPASTPVATALGCSMAAQAEQCMLLAQRAGALSAAAEAHWAALLAFHDTAWYMLTPLQGARLAVACQGTYPDPIQLALAVERAEAEAGGEPIEATGSRPAEARLQAAELEEHVGEGDAAAAIRSWQQQAVKHLDCHGAASGSQLSSALFKFACPQ